MKRAIITGPTGGIGIALINKLIEENVEVIAICRPGSKRINNIPSSELVTIVQLELNELDKMYEVIERKKLKLNATNSPKEAMINADNNIVFYHLGWDGTFGVDARNNVEGQLKNIQYTIKAVEVAAKIGCNRFVGAGSQAEYGRVEGKLSAEIPAFPETGYGMAKLSARHLSRLRCSQLGLDHIWTRILSVYGPGDGSKTMVMSTITKLINGENVDLTKGEQKWDYLFSKDAAEAMYLLGDKGCHGKVYCLGGGKALALKDYICKIKETVIKEIQIYNKNALSKAQKTDVYDITKIKNAKLNFGAIPYADKQVMHLVADISELTKDTGFKVRYSFEDGIKETIHSLM